MIDREPEPTIFDRLEAERVGERLAELDGTPAGAPGEVHVRVVVDDHGREHRIITSSTRLRQPFESE